MSSIKDEDYDYRNRAWFLDTAEELINGPRAKEYGSAHLNHQRIADVWSVVLGIEVTAQQVVACMIGLKLARLANTPHMNSDDTWTDIIGYAALGGEISNDG